MNQVSWTRQLGLAVILVVLGGFAVWSEYKYRPAKEAADEQAKKLFAVAGNSIQSVRISSGSAGTAELALNCLDISSKLCKPGDQSKWQISEPTQLKADDANVNSLISALNQVSSPESISLKEESTEKRAALLKDYGLSPEARKTAKRLSVTTDQGTTTLILGGTHPIGDQFFAVEEKAPAGQKSSGTVDDSIVYLVPSYFKTHFERDLSFWRDKKILTLASFEIESFQLDGGNGSFEGDRKARPWTLKSKGQELAADADQVTTLLSTATNLTARAFTAEKKDEPLAVTTLKGASRVLTLTLKKEKGSSPQEPAPVTLTLYRKKVGADPVRTYATVSNADPLFEVESNVIDRLAKSPTDLRLSKLMTSMERFNIKKIEFSGKPLGSTPLVLAQKDGKWTMDGDSREVDSEKVQALLDKLSSSKVKEFVSGSKIPTGETDGITLKTTDDKKGRAFQFWKNTTHTQDKTPSKAHSLFAKDLDSQQKEAILMDQAVSDTLPWERDFFVKAKPKAQASPPSEKPKS